MQYEIYWKTYEVVDSFSGRLVKFEGWSHTNDLEYPVGIFDSYSSAIAHAMGIWGEYCEYFRARKAK